MTGAAIGARAGAAASDVGGDGEAAASVTGDTGVVGGGLGVLEDDVHVGARANVALIVAIAGGDVACLDVEVAIAAAGLVDAEGQGVAGAGHEVEVEVPQARADLAAHDGVRGEGSDG